jgi:hypothetical protein
MCLAQREGEIRPMIGNLQDFSRMTGKPEVKLEVIGSSVGLVPTNDVLGSWPTNRHKNVILKLVNGCKMRTKGE